VFAAGAAAGACARTVGSPLSRVTILQQTAATGNLADYGRRAGGGGGRASIASLARDMVAREGWRGLFRGNFADVLRAAPQMGISFACYETYKRAFSRYDATDDKFLARFGAGGCSGVTSILCTYPLDLVRTRYAATAAAGSGSGGAAPTGLWGALRDVVRSDGLRGLYRGAPVACAEKFPNLALNFAMYDWAKDRVASTFGAKSILGSLASGVFAGAVSNTVTFPLDVVMKNLQLDGVGGAARKYAGALDCARQIVAARGVRGLYGGLPANLAKAIPVAATSFMVYDLMKQELGLHVVPESFRAPGVGEKAGEPP